MTDDLLYFMLYA